MKQFAFIGLSALAQHMLESIAQITDQIVVIDKDPVSVDRIKDLVKTAFVADASDIDALEHILPDGIDVAVVDMSGNLEASIMTVHLLKKHGVPEIIVKSKAEDKSEILEIVGATRVVHADKEAASRIVPLILSSTLYNYMPIGGNMVIAEVKIPEDLLGQTLLHSELRKKRGINVVAVRSGEEGDYGTIDHTYQFKKDDVMLIAGTEKDIFAFSGIESAPSIQRMITNKPKENFFDKLFKGAGKKK